jgi:hypothetical protein
LNTIRLTWKDGIATALTAAAVGIYWALLAGAELPLVGSVRGSATAILLAGVGGCVAGAQVIPKGTGVSKWFGFLGTVAFFAGLSAIIWANQTALAIQVGAIIVLWAAATLRHAFGEPPQPPAERPMDQTPVKQPMKIG